MKETIVPVSIVGGVFVLILAIAGVWVYMKSTAAPASNTGSIVLQQMQQDQAGTISTSTVTTTTTTNTTPMDTTPAPAAPKYQIVPGLEAQDVTEGAGTPVKAGENVSVKYTGMLADGTVFDATDLHGGAPFTFMLGGGQVIKGWDLGVVGMKPGGVRMLTIAPELGYGARANGPIPANATLTFKVEMIGPTQ